MEQEPSTLQEAIVYFSNPANCRTFLMARRWPNGVTCPRCGSQDILFLENYNRWQCREGHDSPQFTLKTGTPMEDSPIGLDKWLTAMWQVVNCKNGVSSCEIARAIGITQKSAWFMDHRIRCMLGLESPNKLSGHVEADESFIGGKARNMHAGKRARKITGTGGKDKTAVMGILERSKDGKHSTVRTTVVPNRKKRSLQGSVNPAFQKAYVSVEPFHLFRYLDEQAYRFNNRRMNDAQRFDLAVKGMVGKRLTFDQLTGKIEAQA